MAFVYVFWALLALSLAGLAVNVLAFKRGVARRVTVAAVVLKSLVVLAFAAYFAALSLGLFAGWGDLTTFASLIVLSPVLLAAAFVCDVLALRAVRTAART
jgi:hypothetical protein